MKGKKGKSKGRSRPRKNWYILPLNATSYSGPIEPRLQREAENPVPAVLKTVLALSSDSLGTISIVYTNQPTGSPDFGNFAAIYQKYRVRGMSAKFCPFFVNFANTAGLALNMVNYVMFLVRDVTTTIPTTYPAAISFDGSSIQSIQVPCKKEIRMNGNPDDLWVDTDSPKPAYGIGMIATGLSFSTLYGQVEITWLVDFYGRI